MSASSSPRVLIIGAGPCGCAALRAFEDARSKGASIPEVVCVERQSVPHGMWNYTWRTGTDERGNSPLPNSMYRHLWSNGPKECIEFHDYGWRDHFGRAVPSFPPRGVVREYLEGYLSKWGVREWIRFGVRVVDCAFEEEGGRFRVRMEEAPGDEGGAATETESFFDYVICCTGHSATQNVPSFPGLDRFPGRVMHSGDFRTADEFRDKHVLIVGSSLSAEDVASQLYKFGARKITLSYRSNPMPYKWPANFETRPLLTRVDAETRTAHFRDDSCVADVDAIILCTGFKYHFPFLRPEMRLQTENRIWIDTLHEGVVWPHNPRLMYLGMHVSWFTFPYYEAQAWYARDVVLGRIRLPGKAEMEAQWTAQRAKEEGLKTEREMVDFQKDHMKRLTEMTDRVRYDFDAMADLFVENGAVKNDGSEGKGIMGYRDRGCKGIFDGEIAPKHGAKWIEEFDDSVEAFVNQ